MTRGGSDNSTCRGKLTPSPMAGGLVSGNFLTASPMGREPPYVSSCLLDQKQSEKS